MCAARRSVHLVGNIPAGDVRDVFSLLIENLDGRLGGCVHDGEAGDRLNWVNGIVESLRSHPDLELARDGAWTSYQDTPRFRVPKGHRFQSIDLDYLPAFRASWPALSEMRDRLGTDMALQASLPTTTWRGPLSLISGDTQMVPSSLLRDSSCSTSTNSNF